MTSLHRQTGFTLLELLVALALVATLTGLAAAGYQGYLDTARQGIAKQEAASLAIALESHHLVHDSYAAGRFEPDGEQSLAEPPLGWRPADPERPFLYRVAACEDDGLSICYQLTVTHQESGALLVERSGP